MRFGMRERHIFGMAFYEYRDDDEEYEWDVWVDSGGFKRNAGFSYDDGPVVVRHFVYSLCKLDLSERKWS